MRKRETAEVKSGAVVGHAEGGETSAGQRRSGTWVSVLEALHMCADVTPGIFW